MRRIKLNKLEGYFFLLDNFSVKYLKLAFACVKLKKKGEIINIFTTMCLFYGHVGRTVFETIAQRIIIYETTIWDFHLFVSSDML